MFISPQLHAALSVRGVQLATAVSQGKHASSLSWQYYVDSEQQLIDLMQGNPPSEEAPGNIEVSWVLYFFNNCMPADLAWLTLVLEALSMPASQITAAEWASWEVTWQGQGVLMGDGSLVSEAPYAVMDPGWSLAFIDYVLLELRPDLGYLQFLDPIEQYTPFGTTPAQLTFSDTDTVTLNLFSDWGTGNYADGNLADSPAVLISQQITSLNQQLDTPGSTLNIHLGDTYYAGTSAEMTNKLVDCWPGGTEYNFTLDGNHEMYDGAWGLFSAVLTDSGAPLPSGSLFAQQQGTTYFSIEVGNWLVVGLDTSYYDTSELFMTGALVDDNQVPFLNQIGQQVQGGKQLILLTHHNPLFTDGSQTTPLYDQVMQALGSLSAPQSSYTIQPTYWYWGHVHNGIVYQQNSSLTGDILCRCIGNGAIPIGNASWLENNSAVEFYTNTPLADPTTNQALRVMNGFMTLTISTDGTVTETFYNQDGSVAWPVPAS